MRIIAGKAKGFILKVPKRRATRPATELVRGAIFSMLDNIACSRELVLDLFSGSGSLGIEALSRGAGRVDFVEHERRSCAIIRENLKKTGFTEQARVYCSSAKSAVGFLKKEYDIILMDPPYSDLSIGSFLGRLASSGLVGDETTLVTTHSSRLSLAPSYAQLKLIKENRHGDSSISVYQKEV